MLKSQAQEWLPFYLIVLRESYKRRHIDLAHRMAVRWALRKVRETRAIA